MNFVNGNLTVNCDPNWITEFWYVVPVAICALIMKISVIKYYYKQKNPILFGGIFTMGTLFSSTFIVFFASKFFFIPCTFFLLGLAFVKASECLKKNKTAMLGLSTLFICGLIGASFSIHKTAILLFPTVKAVKEFTIGDFYSLNFALPSMFILLYGLCFAIYYGLQKEHDKTCVKEIY